MATVSPGSVAYNSTVPFGAQQLDQASWTSGAAFQLLNGIIDQAMQYGGDTSKIGMPATWPYGPIPRNSVLADGSVSPLLAAQVQQYVNSPAAQADTDFGNWLGVQFSAATPGGYIDKPLSVQEQVAQQEQARRDLETLMKLSGGGGTSTVRTSSSGSSRSSSGGSSGTDYGARLGYESASADIDAQLAREKFELQKELMLLQFALDNDPNNPELLLKQKQLDESIRQFNATLAQKTQAEEKALQLQRAKTVADYGANPGDAVAREYFLRQGANPTGSAVNIFTGQPTGQQMTLSEVMQHNAPIVSPSLQGAMAGTPIPEGGTPTAPPPTEPPPEEEPQFAYGTNFGGRGVRSPDPKVTPDGWTRAPEFIAGDPQMPGMANPEKIQMRVKDGRPEAKVTPLSQMMGGGVRRRGGPMAQMSDRTPMFASGTDAWRISQAVSGTSTGSSGNTNWDWMYEQPQEPVYQPTDYSYLSQLQTQASPWSPTNTSLSSPSTTTATTSPSGPVDANKDGLDDVTGWANGVISDPSSPSGYSYNGTPTKSDGSPYAPTAPPPPPTAPAPPPTAPAPPPAPTANPWEDLRTQLGIPEGSVGNTLSNPYLSEILNGGSSTALVENRNSPYYGMTMEQAALLEHWGNVNPGPDMVGVGTGNFMLPGDNGEMVPAYTTNVVPNQAAAGILTEAELSQGKTQSVNPRLPGYRPPEGMPIGEDAARILGTIPGYTPPATTLPVVQGGIAQTPDGGGTYTLMAGDVKTPEGGYLRYNPLSMQYEPVMPQLTKITSAEEFYALPPDVRQMILSGQPTGYLLADAGTQWLSSATNPSASFSAQRMMTQEEFNALSPEQQKAFYEGDFTKYPELSQFAYSPGSYQAPSQPESTTYGSPFWRPTGLATLPAAEPVSGAYDYSSYFTPELLNQLYPPPPPPTPTPITPVYPPGYEPETAPPPATGGATPPAGTTTPPPGGTTAPPPAGTTAPPPAGGTTAPPPASGQDALQQALAQLLGLSYGNETYQNLPALQYARGNLSGGEYDTVSNTPVEVPGLGLTGANALPGAAQMMNYEMLQKLIENGSFDLLNSLYTAGNLPLSYILALARARAPLGSASETSLIETT